MNSWDHQIQVYKTGIILYVEFVVTLEIYKSVFIRITKQLSAKHARTEAAYTQKILKIRK
jgi:hypothetical protein